jgi:hypothetical protein
MVDEAQNMLVILSWQGKQTCEPDTTCSQQSHILDISTAMLTLATNIWGSYVVDLRTLAVAVLCGIIG